MFHPEDVKQPTPDIATKFSPDKQKRLIEIKKETQKLGRMNPIELSLEETRRLKEKLEELLREKRSLEGKEKDKFAIGEEVIISKSSDYDAHHGHKGKIIDITDEGLKIEVDDCTHVFPKEDVKKIESRKTKEAEEKEKEKTFEGRDVEELFDKVIKWLDWAEDNGWSIKAHDERPWEINKDGSVVKIWATDKLLEAFEKEGFLDKTVKKLSFTAKEESAGLKKLLDRIKGSQVISLRKEEEDGWYLQILKERKERGKEKIIGSESFKLGARVRIRRDSKYAHQNKGVGTIIEKREKRWATVKFDDGYQNNIYRIGKEEEVCDLELADED